MDERARKLACNVIDARQRWSTSPPLVRRLRDWLKRLAPAELSPDVTLGFRDPARLR